MKKSALLILITVALAFSMAQSSFAAKAVQVVINGTTKHFSQPPIIQNGTTLVPLRDMFEALGGELVWDEAKQTAFVHKGETCLFVEINNEYATVAQYEPGGACSSPGIVYMGVPAKIINGKTMVPLRFASEYLGATVQWDQPNYTIRITTTLEESANVQQSNVPIDVNGRTIQVRDRVKFSFFMGK
ncbi:copper amine oxidase N-terminal domain-containing protein [Brevibacillus fluminis]|uniref:copper amine oxidase N-terminal domain-containing protein n=1 Tax=Brevibacillus fluminis TaxID=511487 RepID=UPI003F8B9E31